MALTLPNLDDRSFDQLVAEGRALIPRNCPAWTNHNVSDPGIALLELFAYLTETAIFQVNQLPPASLESFLRLLNVGRLATDTGVEPIADTIRRALRELQTRQAAVTAEDFIRLARSASDEVARALFTVAHDPLVVRSGEADPAIPAGVVVIVPNKPDETQPAPDRALLDLVSTHLERRRLLTVRVRVLPPVYVGINVSATVVRRPGSGLKREDIIRILTEFLHPLRGGPDGGGWPFGRSVYRSELFQRLEREPDIDHVEALKIGKHEPGKPDSVDDSNQIHVGPLELVYLFNEYKADEHKYDDTKWPKIPPPTELRLGLKG
jgi:hypothetical protein